MTEQEFLNGIQGCLNDYEANLVDKKETANALLGLFLKVLEPVSGAKNHLELFIYRVREMRKVQQQFFDGKRSVLGEAKKREAIVDNTINTMLDKLGYSVAELEKKAEQKTLY